MDPSNIILSLDYVLTLVDMAMIIRYPDQIPANFLEKLDVMKIAVIILEIQLQDHEIQLLDKNQQSLILLEVVPRLKAKSGLIINLLEAMIRTFRGNPSPGREVLHLVVYTRDVSEIICEYTRFIDEVNTRLLAGGVGTQATLQKVLDTLPEKIKDRDWEERREILAKVVNRLGNQRLGSASESVEPKGSQILPSDELSSSDYRRPEGMGLLRDSVAYSEAVKAGDGFKFPDTDPKGLRAGSSNFDPSFWSWKNTERETETNTTTPGNKSETADTWDTNTAPLPGPIQSHTFLIDLDLQGFLNEQQYDKDDELILERIITFTSIGGQTAALTSGEYLRSTWPTTAEHVLGLLKRIIRFENEVWREEKVDDDSSLKMKASPGELTAQVSGREAFCDEILDQLGWICAAFQSSKMWYRPQISQAQIARRRHGNSWKNLQIAPRFTSFEHMRDGDGCCWTGLVQNPAIVRGPYPIPCETPKHNGLEISLKLMALLIGTDRVTEFAGRLYIKGFSAMAVLTTQATDIFVWHFVFNQDGSHISYTDERALKAVSRSKHPIDMRLVESARHILGWCPEAADSTGRPNAHYDIGYSGLPKPSPGCAFEKIQISAGYIITGGITAIPGKKDKAIHLTNRDDYISKLKWISTKFVLFYDVSTRRGWLVNGLGALVHILRASLRHDETDGFEFLFKWDEMEDPPATWESVSAREAAIIVLSSENNQKLPLWRKPESGANETDESGSNTPQADNKKTKEKAFFRFKDRVEQIYRVMEQIVTHQSHVEEQDGVGFRVRLSPRRRLEGFNFMDIASGEDPIWPQETSISALGLGWVDLVRSLNAITLFGRDFGDLITPSAYDSSAKMCPEWERLPKGKDYLAVSGSVLKDILKKGNTDSTPWRLVDDVWWHNPHFSQDCVPCNRETASTALGRARGPLTHTDRVQVLLPGSSIHKMNLKPFKGKGKGIASQPVPPLPNTAALVFGHSLMLPLRWSDHGDPVEDSGSLPQLTDVENTSHIESQESAEGTSSITSSTENTTPSGGSGILGSESGNASTVSNPGIGRSLEGDAPQLEGPSRTLDNKGIKLIRGWFKRRPVVE